MTLSPAFLLAGLVCLGLIGLVAVLKRLTLTRARRARFRQRPVLNKGEVRLLRELERAAPVVLGHSVRVCPHVSYGEFLTCANFGKFVRINSKRAGFVVTTGADHVALVVELQGAGQGGAGQGGPSAKSAGRARRSARIKRAALDEAGIPLLEVDGKISRPALLAKIRAQTTTQQKRPAQ